MKVKYIGKPTPEKDLLGNEVLNPGEIVEVDPEDHKANKNVLTVKNTRGKEFIVYFNDIQELVKA